MKDSNRTPMGRSLSWIASRSLSWIAISGSLVCVAGCAGLTGPTQSPTGLFPQAAAQTRSPSTKPFSAGSPASTGAAVVANGTVPNAASTTGAPTSASPTGVANSNVAQANSTSRVPSYTRSAGYTSTSSPSSNAIAQTNANQSSLNQPYVARQVPNTTPSQGYNFAAPSGPPLPPGSDLTPPAAPYTGLPDPYAPVAPYPPYQVGPRVREADLVINGFPARTGRIMLGGAVNSDAGLTGQLTIDERNFDITRWPTSFRDLFSGTAFRGAGQTFRIEAAPGTDFKRYTMQFADPNLFGYKPVSMSVSGFLFDRRYNDWDEERLGGRLAFGYRVTPDLSVSAGISGQNVRITRPRVADVPELERVTGNNELYSGEVALTHDTRDSPIQASRGHYFEFKFEEVFGKFDYARFELEYRKYWLIAQRADGSGRQTLSYSTQVGFSGKETPIFENFFAGGYATIRGFEFRGASPIALATAPSVGAIEAGGRFQWLNTVEYMFPITADDAFRGVAFVDFGTVEKDVEINADQYRVAPGLGLRVAIPMLGPAPLAFDFAYPVAKADTDQTRLFSFYMSLIR